MIKKILPLILFVFLVTISTRSVWAQYLTLTRIGTLSTVGTSYSSYSVTGVAPDLSGTATPGATVIITVNSVSASTSAALSGVWTSRPTNIVAGTNSVSLASGNESLSFLLVYTPTATPTATPVATSGALPETGNSFWPIFIIGVGIIIFVTGRSYKEKVGEEWNI